MFLEKIRKLAWDLKVPQTKLNMVAKEALLYGMRLKKTPSDLKKSLKEIGADSKQATPMWSGNAYLLITLPSVFSDRRCKIPCLEDFIFAKKVLSQEHIQTLTERVDNMPQVTPSELLQELFPAIRFQAYRGSFIPQFDRSAETKDVQQDLALIAIKIINKEFSNFKTHDRYRIESYLGYCMNRKGNTYLKSKTPKMMSIPIEFIADPDDECIAEDWQMSRDSSIDTVEMLCDLEKILTPAEMKAVRLLVGDYDDAIENEFNEFLKMRYRNFKKTAASYRKAICDFTGCDVFSILQSNPNLIQYLGATTQTAP